MYAYSIFTAFMIVPYLLPATDVCIKDRPVPMVLGGCLVSGENAVGSKPYVPLTKRFCGLFTLQLISCPLWNLLYRMLCIPLFNKNIIKLQLQNKKQKVHITITYNQKKK